MLSSKRLEEIVRNESPAKFHYLFYNSGTSNHLLSRRISYHDDANFKNILVMPLPLILPCQMPFRDVQKQLYSVFDCLGFFNCCFTFCVFRMLSIVSNIFNNTVSKEIGWYPSIEFCFLPAFGMGISMSVKTCYRNITIKLTQSYFENISRICIIK